MDFTTVARGYVEAGKRGLVESVVGRGTFVRRAAMVRGEPAPGRSRADFSMNMPPEPRGSRTAGPHARRLRERRGAISRRSLRYQGFGGSPADRDAASAWLGRRALVPSQERIFVAPGAHAAMRRHLSACSPSPARPCFARRSPIRACAPSPRSSGFSSSGSRPIATASFPRRWRKRVERHAPKAIYLNPTLQNPTTITIPERRRAAICSIARRHGVMIVEDDAYGFMPNARSRASRGHRA